MNELIVFPFIKRDCKKKKTVNKNAEAPAKVNMPAPGFLMNMLVKYPKLAAIQIPKKAKMEIFTTEVSTSAESFFTKRFESI